MKVLAMVELILLLTLLVSLGSAVLFSLGVKPLLGVTRSWAPKLRHRLLLLFSLSPLALSLAVLAAALLPGTLALWWPRFDHCLVHGDQHLHLCFVHLHSHANLAVLGVLGIAGGSLLWRLARALLDLGRARELVRQLGRLARWDEELGAGVLETAQPLCLQSGVLTPRVLLSRGFVQGARPGDVHIALAHERAHAERRDILWRFVARFASALFLPGPRHALLAALDLSAERSCDEQAAQRTGSRLQVAEAILEVERLLRGVPQQLAPAVAAFSGHTEARVAALLRPIPKRGTIVPALTAAAVLLCAIVLGNHSIHHAAESLLAALTH